ncbi:protein of unknown function [Candidatus Filomicrobium marinum]|uniref:Uncharacterized protein n=1 Tax=Candidatus Filomicrobium marinum TaxID=1608628 RepID=A0A0D6JCD5_9HYPH|nr:protein of unknown function [Candidatus Filomicrobium marinum]
MEQAQCRRLILPPPLIPTSSALARTIMRARATVVAQMSRRKVPRLIFFNVTFASLARAPVAYRLQPPLRPSARTSF